MYLRNLFTLILVCLTGYIYAQDAIVYEDEEGYIKKTGTNIGPVTIVPNDVNYTVRSEYFQFNKALKKHYWAVVYNDSLLINCKVVFKKPHLGMGDPHIIFSPDGYSLVRFRTDRYLCFSAGRSNLRGMSNKTRSQNYLTAAILAGPAVAAVIALSPGQKQNKLFGTNTDRYQYMLNLQTNELTYLNRGLMRYMVDTLSPTDDVDLIEYLKQLIKNEDSND